MIFHDHFVSDFDGFRTEPPDPESEAGLQRALPSCGLQPDPAAGGVQVLPEVDRAEVSALADRQDSARQSVLRRLLCRELGQRGSLWRCDRERADSRRSKSSSAASAQGWARFTYGGSTGGWEALAVQVFYPDHYNGAFAACPDPVDFHAFTNIDLYNDKNAFYLRRRAQARAAAGDARLPGAHAVTTEDNNAYELALGDHGRSGEQFDIWQAVYGPVGADGYPQADLRQSDGRDRSQRGRILARALRSGSDPRARLGKAWARSSRARSTSMCGVRRHVLSERCRLPHGGFSEERPRIRPTEAK